MKEKLNEKLARWTGWTPIIGEYSFGSKLVAWKSPDSQLSQKEVPDFTSSLDACFKWLVPKVLELNPDAVVEVWQSKDGAKGFIWHRNSSLREEVDDETPALALCRAIDKLVERE